MTITTLTALLFCSAASAASLTTLRHREHRQRATLHADRGTLKFFKQRPWLARTRPGREALRFARAELRWTGREIGETKLALRPATVPAIICRVFASRCGEALQVARCESRFSVAAANGQYRGLFQMGSAERARFGGSTLDAWEQTRAAFRYFTVAGWGPWECRP
jgi:hypothetical protein